MDAATSMVKPTRLPKKIVVIPVLLLVALALVIFFVFINTPKDLNVAQVKALVARHYLLPQDEDPALATVTDRSKLTTPFLAKSENGDKVLIYQTKKIVIIYRPSIDKLIAVGPVSIAPAVDPAR